MENKKLIQVEEKVTFQAARTAKHTTYVCNVRCVRTCSVRIRTESGRCLFMNGIGTLLFILITKGKAPAYLGSSFAFLAPAGIVIEKWGYSYALGGFVAVGFLGCVLALIHPQIRFQNGSTLYFPLPLWDRLSH